MTPLDQYLHNLVHWADRIAEATRTQDPRIFRREIDHARAAAVPAGIYDPDEALLTALAAQVGPVTTRQEDRIAWALRCPVLDMFLRDGLPERATGIAAAVRGTDRPLIASALRSAIDGTARVWPDPVAALAVALGIQIDTEVPMRARNAWTLDLPEPTSRVLEVAA